MGMYTALSLGVELKKDLPDEVANILSFMVHGHDLDRSDECPTKPDHAFFRCDRWPHLFRMDSYYFSYDSHWTFRLDHPAGSYYLSGVSNLKNYDGEIRKFVDWIEPYLHECTGGFIGWTQYEEDRLPTLIIRKCEGEQRSIEYWPTEKQHD